MSHMSFRKELKQLQKSYIGICLQVIKPTFLIKEFVYSLDIQQDVDLIAKDQFVYVNVYDQDQKTNKMLILCLSEDYKKYSLFYQEITKKSLRSDLILNIIDHYYLDADRIFYVFEMDSFNFTSTQLEQKYQYAGLVSQAKNKIIKYCNESLNMYHFRNKQNYQEFYICITPQDKLKVKVNLIDPNWNIKQYFEKNLLLDYLQSHEKNKAEQQKNSKMEEEVENLEEQQYQITEMSKMIQDFEESLNQQIKKEDFVFIIQDMYSNILNYHPIEVFEMIQTRQKYDAFEILQSDEKKFELKVNKQSQIISLQGFQFSSLSKAQKLKSEYQFIISNKQLSSAIISVDLMIQENQYYVITENIFVELLDKQKNNLAELQNLQFSNENFILLSFLKFSYELLTKYDFQITKVKPQSLLLLDKDQISSDYQRNHIFNLRDQYEEKMKIYNMDQKKEKNYNYFQSSLKQFNVLDIDKLNDTFQKNKIKIQNQNTEKICNNNINMSLFTMGNNLNQFDPFGLNEIDLVLKRYLKEQKIVNFTIDAVSFDDFQSEYVHILNNSIRNNQNMKKYMDKKFKTEYQNSTYFQLIKLFFQKISENQKQVVSKIYDQLLIGFDIFNTISNLDSYDTFQNIQISNDDFTKVKVLINETHQLYLIKQLKAHKKIQIVCLRIPIFSQLNKEIQQTLIDTKEVYKTQFDEQIKQLNLFFSRCNSQCLNQYKSELIKFILYQINKNIQLKILSIQKEQFDIKKIVNSDILTEHQLQLISVNSFLILVLKLERRSRYTDENDQSYIQIMVIEEEIFYLIGYGEQILVKQSDSKSIVEIIQLQHDLLALQDHFGQEYILKFKNEKLQQDFLTNFLQELKDLKKIILYITDSTNCQFNLLGCKQIQQLNLELYSFRRDCDYELNNIIQQIDQTQINNIKVICIEYDGEFLTIKDFFKNLTLFYKLQRVVSINFVKEYLEDDRDENDDNGSQNNFAENVEKQNRSF